ncbi:rab-GTPase-TBC domain-containing protein [Trametes punicea]|nr:rab-GTPase-TBC domain-containing protein [Trametes punicea]
MGDEVVKELQSSDDAVNAQVDWQALRARSIRPHGFGQERVQLWPRLLHLDNGVFQDRSMASDRPVPLDREPEKKDPGETLPEDNPHADERQIGLDTDRSFVLYPVETPHRETLQAGLNRLIVTLFRRRPRLHYFQGYHDIVSVLFLTLPKELHFPVTEKISLHRVRDSMGSTLEPVVGLLRILKRVLHLADEKFAAVLERAAPLPYYALSNLLTLFSHDVPTLPLIQHIFDYLLSRPPIAVVYLAAALTLTRRQEVQMLEEEGEEGMMHSLLTGLPDLYEEDEHAFSEQSVSSETGTNTEAKTEEAGHHPPEDADQDRKMDALRVSVIEDSGADVPVGSSTTYMPPASLSEDAYSDDAEQPQNTDSRESNDELGPTEPRADLHLSGEGASVVKNEEPPEAKADPAEELGEPTMDEKPSPTRTTSPEPIDMIRPQRPRVSLTTLLSHADELYAQFPPTHPSVAVSSIMGPQSAMLTWSERCAEMPDDDEAELMVTKPELVVLPYIEPDDDIASDEASSSYHTREHRERKGEKESKKEKRRRKLRKPRRLTDIVVQHRTMVAGAVLVLGVAVAVYGYNAGLPGARGGHHRSGLGREWRRMSRSLGSAFMAAGERVMEGIRHGL